jgi:hypothetical protein
MNTPVPSGFVKPTMLSNQLTDFLKIPRGSMLPRTQVTCMMQNYVKVNNLGDPLVNKVIYVPALPERHHKDERHACAPLVVPFRKCCCKTLALSSTTLTTKYRVG